MPRVLLSFVVSAAISMAQESVCLKSGFCLTAASHMVVEETLVVQSGPGTLQFPVNQVDSIVSVPASDPADALVVNPISSGNAAATSEELLVRAALREGLEPGFVRSVAMVESGMRQNALSSKGAIGLMQLMPLTAGKLGVNAKAADQNALGGAAFLRELLLKYNGDSAMALAAYNAGPGAVKKYKGVPPYLETHRYIIRVLHEYERQHRMEAQKSLQANR